MYLEGLDFEWMEKSLKDIIVIKSGCISWMQPLFITIIIHFNSSS